MPRSAKVSQSHGQLKQGGAESGPGKVSRLQGGELGVREEVGTCQFLGGQAKFPATGSPKLPLNT